MVVDVGKIVSHSEFQIDVPECLPHCTNPDGETRTVSRV